MLGSFAALCRELLKDFLAFLIFFYLLCIPGLPFALILAVSLFPHFLWLASDRVVVVAGAASFLVVLGSALVFFLPATGFSRRLWDRFMHRVRTSEHRRFRVWAGLAGGMVAVSVAALPLAVFWLGLRLLPGETVPHFMMCCTAIALLPALFWILWIAVVLGKPHPILVQKPFIGAMLLRMQLSFIDGIEAIRTPAAAARARRDVLEAAQKHRQ